MQRNPSTGKRIRNPVTRKLQRAVPTLQCSDCPTVLTLDEVRLTFENVISKDGCFDAFLFPFPDISFSGMPDINNPYTLQKLTGLPSNNCQWNKTLTGDYGTRTVWSSTNGSCSGSSIVHTYDQLRITAGLTMQDNQFVIFMFAVLFNIAATATVISLFAAGNDPPDTLCMNLANLANENSIGGSLDGGYDGTGTTLEL